MAKAEAKAVRPSRKRPQKKRKRLGRAQVELLADSFRELYVQGEGDPDFREVLNQGLASEIGVEEASDIFTRYLKSIGSTGGTV